LALTIGVAVLRALPEAPPALTLAPAVLAGLRAEVRVVLGTGALPAAQLLDLRQGSVVPLRTKVAGEGELNLAGQRIAFGTAGCATGTPHSKSDR
jgi:flagellar motor switch/type III secretory pathway protein FliN